MTPLNRFTSLYTTLRQRFEMTPLKPVLFVFSQIYGSFLVSFLILGLPYLNEIRPSTE